MANMKQAPKRKFGLGDLIVFGIIAIVIVFMFAGSCGGQKAETIKSREEFALSQQITLWQYFFAISERTSAFIALGFSGVTATNLFALLISGFKDSSTALSFIIPAITKSFLLLPKHSFTAL